MMEKNLNNSLSLSLTHTHTNNNNDNNQALVPKKLGSVLDPQQTSQSQPISHMYSFPSFYSKVLLLF